MKIYFRPDFSKSCFFQTKAENSIDLAIANDLSLLKLLQDFAGIYRPQISDMKRIVAYRKMIQGFIDDSSFIKASFDLDSMAVAKEILRWRDILVENGWRGDPNAEYKSKKLQLVNGLESKDIQNGLADQWAEIVRLSETREILPHGTELHVPAKYGKPLFNQLIGNLEKHGTVIVKESGQVSAKGNNLAKVQALLSDPCNKEKIRLDVNDDSFLIWHFRTDAEIYKYIAATEQADADKVIVCANDKRFDNQLSYLSRNHSGSIIANTEPQIIQLFKIGLGLFEYPYNIGTWVNWLQAPVSPLKDLRRKLYRAVESSRGLFNDKWKDAIEEEKKAISEGSRLSEDENKLDEGKRKERISKQLKEVDELVEKFAFQPSESIKKEDVMRFCENMEHWASKMSHSPHYQSQPSYVSQFSALKELFEIMEDVLSDVDTIDFQELQQWATKISFDVQTEQYEAEKGSLHVVGEPDNIATPAKTVIWADMFNATVPSPQLSFLNAAEIEEVGKHGCKPWPDNDMLDYYDDCQCVPVMKATDKLVLAYADYCGIEIARKHPLLIKLSATIENFKDFISTPEINEEAFDTFDKFNNFPENSMENNVLEIGNVGINNREVESYSSLDVLIQHPLSYVCNYAAKLSEKSRFDLSEIAAVKGTVAHRTIELLFNDSQKKYAESFEQALFEEGGILLLPENKIERENLKNRLETGVEKINKFIKENGLEFVGSEKPYKCEWHKQLLEARIDMVLKDQNGYPVILDFKLSEDSKYKKILEDNKALQLAVYKYVLLNDLSDDNIFKGMDKCRCAYVTLPNAKVLTCDDFDGVKPVQGSDKQFAGDLMDAAWKSFEFRYAQFEEGKVELGEGLPLEATEYGSSDDYMQLIPISSDSDNNKYSDNYSKSKGLR